MTLVIIFFLLKQMVLYCMAIFSRNTAVQAQIIRFIFSKHEQLWIVPPTLGWRSQNLWQIRCCTWQQLWGFADKLLHWLFSTPGSIASSRPTHPPWLAKLKRPKSFLQAALEINYVLKRHLEQWTQIILCYLHIPKPRISKLQSNSPFRFNLIP